MNKWKILGLVWYLGALSDAIFHHDVPRRQKRKLSRWLNAVDIKTMLNSLLCVIVSSKNAYDVSTNALDIRHEVDKWWWANAQICYSHPRVHKLIVRFNMLSYTIHLAFLLSFCRPSLTSVYWLVTRRRSVIIKRLRCFAHWVVISKLWLCVEDEFLWYFLLPPYYYTVTMSQEEKGTLE